MSATSTVEEPAATERVDQHSHPRVIELSHRILGAGTVGGAPAALGFEDRA